MVDHSFSNKSWETTSPCSQSMFSAASALSAVSPHLGLFHTRRYRPISLYCNLLCPTPQAKKGPERPTFSAPAIFIPNPHSPSLRSGRYGPRIGATGRGGGHGRPLAKPRRTQRGGMRASFAPWRLGEKKVSRCNFFYPLRVIKLMKDCGFHSAQINVLPHPTRAGTIVSDSEAARRTKTKQTQHIVLNLL